MFDATLKANIYCSLVLCSSTSVTMATATAEVIVTVGGEDDKVVLRSVESFDPVTNQWKNLACLPFAVSKHGLVVSGERLALALLPVSHLNNLIYPMGSSKWPISPRPLQIPLCIWQEESFLMARPAGRCGVTTPASTPGLKWHQWTSLAQSWVRWSQTFPSVIDVKVMDLCLLECYHKHCCKSLKRKCWLVSC